MAVVGIGEMTLTNARVVNQAEADAIVVISVLS